MSGRLRTHGKLDDEAWDDAGGTLMDSDHIWEHARHLQALAHDANTHIREAEMENLTDFPARDAGIAAAQALYLETVKVYALAMIAHRLQRPTIDEET